MMYKGDELGWRWEVMESIIGRMRRTKIKKEKRKKEQQGGYVKIGWAGAVRRTGAVVFVNKRWAGAARRVGVLMLVNSRWAGATRRVGGLGQLCKSTKDGQEQRGGKVEERFLLNSFTDQSTDRPRYRGIESRSTWQKRGCERSQKDELRKRNWKRERRGGFLVTAKNAFFFCEMRSQREHIFKNFKCPMRERAKWMIKPVNRANEQSKWSEAERCIVSERSE